MPEPTAEPGPAEPEPPAPPRGGRAGGVAWRIGWVLLAAVGMSASYAALVVIGR
jgi:hypothetical protein